MEKSNILEIAELIISLNGWKLNTKEKAEAVRLAVENGLITADEGLDLIIEFVN